jgi:hypothetical protein
MNGLAPGSLCWANRLSAARSEHQTGHDDPRSMYEDDVATLHFHRLVGLRPAFENTLGLVA